MDDRAKMSYYHGHQLGSFASRALKLTPNPTRVAIEELQLHDLQNADAAVPPMDVGVSNDDERAFR